MSRKVELLTPVGAEQKEGEAERPGVGSVKLLGRSLEGLAREMTSVAELRSQLAGGMQVVELEPEKVEHSPVSDRLWTTEDDAFHALVDSVRQHGQQVPILVRPNAKKAGYFEVAYGHRRLAAAARLGLKVRAVVRAMSDEELVIAQGKENTERRDLSFIERALFGSNLERAGFDRATIIAALSLDKTEVTRLLGVARSIPEKIIRAIGPAPKAGRSRWMELGVLLQGKEAVVMDLIATPGFSAADTDVRFSTVLNALVTPRSKSNAFNWMDPQGRPVVKIERSATRTHFSVDERLAPRFGAYLEEHLGEIYASFSQDQQSS
jgi:ParB family transcriptional regulator, chromosome partitioning protein